MLSVVIITFNEEKNILRCLESVQQVADEVVVVDSGSTDQTQALVKDMGVRWIEHPFEGHIQQKNFAMQQAQFDWVLSLDADEALEEVLREEILKEKEKGFVGAYRFKRLNNYCGQWIRHGTWYPDKRIRLVNRQQAIWGGRNPHDELRPHADVEVKEFQGHILHYTLADLEAHLKQINYFSTLAAQSKFESGVKFSLAQLLLNPIWRFLKAYILKAGFRDGYLGFQLAIMAGYAGFLRYAKLRALWKDEQQNA
ncbi:MAG: glycosyltransferase family 2 protein [Bacteroidota bacterium]